MTEKEIPADVMEAAAAAVKAMPDRPPFKADVLNAIARAIMAERERCAAAIENWNADLSKGEIIDNAIRRLAARVRRGQP